MLIYCFSNKNMRFKNVHLVLCLTHKIREPCSSLAQAPLGSVTHSTKKQACALCKNGNQAQIDQGNSTV